MRCRLRSQKGYPIPNRRRAPSAGMTSSTGRRSLRHGLARLSDTAFREDRDDFVLDVHDLREGWLRKGLLENVPLLAEIATTSLYAIACKRANPGASTSKFLFKCVASCDRDKQRYRTSDPDLQR